MKAVGLIWLAGLALLLNGCFAPAPDEGVCGDDEVNIAAGEECDDGNSADGDGCESTCMWPKWQSFTTINTDGGLADNWVAAIATESDGGKWFGTAYVQDDRDVHVAIGSARGKWVDAFHGLSHFSADNTTWTTFTPANTDGGLTNYFVWAIAIDSAGGKWFGISDWNYEYGGVGHLLADNTTWTTFTPANTDGGLVDKDVWAIAIDSAGGKWVSTNGGVSHLSADNTTWTTFTPANTDGGLADNKVRTIAIDSAGGKWIGTYGGGVSHLSADNTTWTTFTTANTDGGLAHDGVASIAIDSAGGKWVSTYGGVSHLSADNTTWTTFTTATTDGGLADNKVRTIAIDSAGGKWFGTYGAGVSHLSADNTTWTTFTKANTDGGLVNNYVLAIAIDSAGGKWFGTYGGVSYWTATFGM